MAVRDSAPPVMLRYSEASRELNRSARIPDPRPDRPETLRSSHLPQVIRLDHGLLKIGVGADVVFSQVQAVEFVGFGGSELGEALEDLPEEGGKDDGHCGDGQDR